MIFNLQKIADVCKGLLTKSEMGNFIPARISIDSRDVDCGDLFVAYRGGNTDGHLYITEAFKKGAICALVERVPSDFDGCLILVDNVQDAIETIACEIRSVIQIPVIGITGSVGKTTAKEMISAVLNQHFTVLKTDKNFNNQIGVPITISRITEQHHAAVIEMGISHPGDMSLLGKIVRPDIMVFTNIGHAHLEYLQSLEGVLKEKTSVLQCMSPSSIVVINGDDPYQLKISCKQKIYSYGLNESCDIFARNITFAGSDGISFDVCGFGAELNNVSVPGFGKHIVYAALEAICLGKIFNLTEKEIRTGLSSFKTVGRRCSIKRNQRYILIDDCYNANPDSMKNSIDSLLMLEGRHICILGDMLELGDEEIEMHRAIGEYAVHHGVDAVITCGELAKYISQGAGKLAHHFQTKDELISALPLLLNKGDVILLKASNSMHFETISDIIISNSIS